jgi:hypothetical protein
LPPVGEIVDGALKQGRFGWLFTRTTKNLYQQRRGVGWHGVHNNKAPIFQVAHCRPRPDASHVLAVMLAAETSANTEGRFADLRC